MYKVHFKPLVGGFGRFYVKNIKTSLTLLKYTIMTLDHSLVVLRVSGQWAMKIFCNNVWNNFLFYQKAGKQVRKHEIS